MSKQTPQEMYDDLIVPQTNPHFSVREVSLATIDQLLLGYELKYIEKAQEVNEENKLILDNVKDLEELLPDQEQRNRAVELAYKVDEDPRYMDKNIANIDECLVKPIRICGIILAKQGEAKLKNWRVEYYERWIKYLNTLRKEKLSTMSLTKRIAYKIMSALSFRVK